MKVERQIQLLRAINASVGRLAPQRTGRRARRLFMTPRRAAPRPWEAKVEARASRRRLAVGWSYLRWGSGPVRVLCMHGWEGRATQFDPIAGVLAPLGATVFAVDGPAHGRSPERVAHPVDFARVMLAAERELGPFDLVIGHSMGAGASLMAVAWGLSTSRLVLLAGPSSLERVLDRFGRFIALPPAASAAFEHQVAETVGFSPAELDLTKLGRTLNLPVLVVHDEQDLEVPYQDALELAEHLPQAELMSLRDVGHRRILRDAAVLERIAEFQRPLEQGARGRQAPPRL